MQKREGEIKERERETQRERDEERERESDTRGDPGERERETGRERQAARKLLSCQKQVKASCRDADLLYCTSKARTSRRVIYWGASEAGRHRLWSHCADESMNRPPDFCEPHVHSEGSLLVLFLGTRLPVKLRRTIFLWMNC